MTLPEYQARPLLGATQDAQEIVTAASSAKPRRNSRRCLQWSCYTMFAQNLHSAGHVRMSQIDSVQAAYIHPAHKLVYVVQLGVAATVQGQPQPHRS